MDDKELHWLAGLLEGEGSFMKGPPSSPNSIQISLQMTDEDVVARVAKFFGTAYHTKTPKNPAWSITYATRVRGVKAASLMTTLKPLMGLKRCQQIETALAHYNPEYGKKIPRPIALEIKHRFRSGETAIDLAHEYKISKWSVYAIHQERWPTYQN